MVKAVTKTNKMLWKGEVRSKTTGCTGKKPSVSLQLQETQDEGRVSIQAD